MLFFLNWWSLD